MFSRVGEALLSSGSVRKYVLPTDMFHARIKNVKEFRRQYTVGEKIGAGKFGNVRIIENIITKSRNAGKYIQIKGYQGYCRIRKEIEILTSLDHKNVLEYIAAYSSKDAFIIVTNCYSARNLYQLRYEREMEESDIIVYVRQICEGLEYLHKNKVVHKDIKPSNIVFENDESSHIRIIDFGFSCNLNDEYSRGLHGTRCYKAPEVYKNESVTGATDMWSLGVTTFWLLSLKFPFPFYDRLEAIENVQFTYGSEFESVSAEARTFIDNLLVWQPELRLTGSSALKHVWLSDPHKLNST